MVKREIPRYGMRERGHKASKYQSSVCEEQLEDNSSHRDDETTDVKPIIYDLRLFQPRVTLCRMSDEDILATRERFKTSEIPHHLEEIPEVSFDVKLENEESDSDQDIDGSWESDGEGGYYKHSVKVEEEDDSSEYESDAKSKSKTRKKRKVVKKYPNVKKLCPICNKLVTGLSEHKKRHDPENARYICEECPKKYFTAKELRIHIWQTHAAQRPFKCNECNKRFSSKGVLQIHEKTHGEPAFVCHICGHKCHQEGSFKIHLERRHTGDKDPSHELVQLEKTVECPLCPKEFKYFPGLINHVFRDHGDNTDELSPRACSECSVSFENGLELFEHLFKQHLDSELLKCGKCGHKESLPSEMEKHLKEDHKVPRQLCRICGTRCFHVALHEERHYPEKAKYECEYCDKKFIRNFGLSNHIRVVHSEEFSHKCPICGKGLRNNCKLREHLITIHRDMDLTPYDCSRCGKKYKTSKELFEHSRIHLAEPRGKDKINVIGQLTCGNCSTSKPFKGFKKFLEHVFEAHPPVDGKIECGKCDKTSENGKVFLNHLIDEHMGDEFRLSCSNCEFTDRSLPVLERHLRRNHKVLKDICEVCGRRVANVADHVLTHSSERPKYECKVCGKKLKHASTVKKHMAMHDNPKPVPSCQVCGKEFTNGGLKLHMIKWHDVLTIDYRKMLKQIKRKTKPVLKQPCPVCNKMVLHMTLHMNIHDPESRKFKCGDCPKIFSRISRLKSHRELMHSEVSVRNFKCSYFDCDKRFHASSNRDSHELTHSDDPKCICPICDHKCHQKLSMKSHIKSKHTGEKDPSQELVQLTGSVKCPLCPREFKYFEGIKTHIYRDHGGHKDDKSPRTCPECKHVLKNGLKLLEHLFKRHMDSNLLKCGKCDHKESLPSQIENHLFEKHKEPSQLCRICGVRTNQLTLHEKRHYPENSDFKCKECDKSFCRYAELMKHMQTQHSDEQPHKCPTCGKEFKLLKEMRNHMLRVHEDSTPFQCSRCEKKFRFYAELSEHSKSHKSERGDECINVIGKLKCVICNKTKTFKDFEGFTNHVFEEHVPSGGKVKCKKCDQGLDNGKDFLSHLIADHMEDKCLLSCSNCDYTETSVSQLEQHMKMQHNVSRTMCKICGKRVVVMREHLLVHDPDPTKCKDCGKKFATVADLLRHKRTHKQTMVECTLCNIKLVGKGALARHMQRWHSVK